MTLHFLSKFDIFVSKIGVESVRDKGGLFQNISKVLFLTSNNIFFLSKFGVFESKIGFESIREREGGGIIIKYFESSS